MYKQVKTYREITLDNDSIVFPVASLECDAGGRYHIIVDDHCYVLVGNYSGKNKYRYRKTPYIFKEAFDVLKNLPELTLG